VSLDHSPTFEATSKQAFDLHRAESDERCQANPGAGEECCRVLPEAIARAFLGTPGRHGPDRGHPQQGGPGLTQVIF